MLIESIISRKKKPEKVSQMTVADFDKETYEKEEENKKQSLTDDLSSKIKNSNITIHTYDELSDEEKLMY
jgi:Fe-S cluster assembly scaffold protein SufB